MASTDDLKHAIDLALSGDWEGAHTVAQRDEADPLYCWLHACLHKMEGDVGNSRHWYRKAGHRFEDFANPEIELQSIRAAIN